MSKIIYSEIFKSIQGEGKYTGIPSLWVRFFTCNLQCDGFGQKNPKDPTTYQLDYKDIDVSKYSRIEDLPVFRRGCDSSYSWSKKFKHLQKTDTPEDIAVKLFELLNGININKFHLVFTGGEPLLPKNQESCVAIYKKLMKDYKFFDMVTFETNATQQMLPELFSAFSYRHLISMSPKLYSVSGEKDAIHIEIIKEYSKCFDSQIKFVCNGTKESWDEIDHWNNEFIKAQIITPVYIMPVGGTLEGQEGLLEGHMNAGVIADEAVNRGYRVSARLQNYLWKNSIGK